MLADVAQRQGDHQASAQAATQLPLLYPDGWEEHVRAAALLARCMALARADTAMGADQRQELAEGYAGKSVAMLQKAVQNGLNDAKHLGAREFEHLQGRQEFQKLLRELK
jgi:hypothetical protein